MKCAPFEYHSPQTLGGVVDLLSRFGDDAKLLAGGQSLIPIMALRLGRYEHIIDLGRVAELSGIGQGVDHLRIGAMTTQASIERNAEVRLAVPLLSRATSLIAHVPIRNRGTVGGSIAHADPAAEYPAVTLALDANFIVDGPKGTRTIPATEFFVSTWTTALESDELLTAIELPIWSGRTGHAIDEIARRRGDFAIAGLACAVELDAAAAIERVGLAWFGMGSTPVRSTTLEAALTGLPLGDVSAAETADLALADLDPPSDVHATASYRRSIVPVLLDRGLTTALQEAARE